MPRKKIKGNVANMLTYLGSLYRNPGEALKEYISNAVDEWQRAKAKGEIEGPCKVDYSLEKGKITIDYNSPGMDEKEFEEALNRVADSAKSGLAVDQIGQLGIGIFAFNQVGTKCTFYSKKAKGNPTIKVTLTKQSDEYEIETAPKRESRESPGMTIVITGLSHDPTKVRGPLGSERLQRLFSEKFDPYLREGYLKTMISCGGREYQVQPLDISLPPVGEAFREVHLSSDWHKIFKCLFWFDPSGKSKVSIRHAGVPVVEDVKAIHAYGLEDSIYGTGLLKGYIDADFLKPLPARNGFEENRDWILFLEDLERILPSIGAEVEELQLKKAEERLTEIQKEAVELARDILNEREFRSLELLGGLRKERGPVVQHPGGHKGKPTGTRTEAPGNLQHYGGMRISFEENNFEEGASLHSRFLSGIVQLNALNQHYRREFLGGTNEEKITYATLMIGKETIAYNDKSNAANDFLEKLLSFTFEVKARAAKVSVTVEKRPRGRPRKPKEALQG